MFILNLSDEELMTSGALEQSISTLIRSFNDLMKSPQLDTSLLEQHRDITLRAFASLIGKFPRYVRRFKTFNQSISIADENFFRSNSDNLVSNILPCLRHRITSLSLSLDPSDIQKNPSQKLKLVLEILLELEQTLDQVEILFNSENSKEIKDSDASNKNLTTFKHERLIWKIKDIVEEIHRLLHTCHNFISALDLKIDTTQQSSSQKENSAVINSLLSKKKQIMINTTFSWELIDKLNEWLNLSDCSIVQTEWQAMVVLVDDALNELLTHLNIRPNDDQVEQLDMDNEEDEDYQQKPLNEKMMKIGNLIVPIIKLCRLFLNKISKTKTNKEPLMMLSDMNSSQLISLLNFTVNISPEIDELIDAFNDSIEEEQEEEYPPGESDSIEDSLFPPIDRLSKCFESCFSVLLPYLDSLSSTQFDDKFHPKAWFETWNHQFTLANQKFKEGCINS